MYPRAMGDRNFGETTRSFLMSDKLGTSGPYVNMFLLIRNKIVCYESYKCTRVYLQADGVPFFLPSLFITLFGIGSEAISIYSSIPLCKIGLIY